MHKPNAAQEDNLENEPGTEKLDVLVAVLAAGRARRFGSPKQLAVVKGATLVRRAALAAGKSRAREACVVVGAYAEQVRSEVADLPVNIVGNHAWDQGQSTSVRAAVKAAEEFGCGYVLFTTVDMPFIDAAHLDNLMDAALNSAYGAAASTCDGRPMVPSVFSSAYFDELKRLEGDKGAGRLLHSLALQQKLALVDFSDERMAFDVDTPSDLERVEMELEN